MLKHHAQDCTWREAIGIVVGERYSGSIEGQVEAQYESETLLGSTTLVNLANGLPVLVDSVASIPALEFPIIIMDFLVAISGINAGEKCSGFSLVGNVQDHPSAHMTMSSCITQGVVIGLDWWVGTQTTARALVEDFPLKCVNTTDAGEKCLS